MRGAGIPPTRRRGPAGIAPGALAAAAFLLALVAVPLAAQEAPQSRADSLRAVVLERVRALSEPLPDTIPADPEDPDDPDPEARAAAPRMDPADRERPVTASVDGRARPGTRPVAPPAGADSVMQALLRLPGYTPATYEGTQADYTAAERRLVLFGTEESHARFSGRGMHLEADTSITYDDREGMVRTRGATLFTPDQGDPVRSRALVYDVAGARGTAWDAETTYQEGTGNWIVRGNLDSVQDGLLFGSGTRFTSCDLDPPHSYFQAEQMKVMAGRVLVARSVRLYFDDVPVAWLPFIAQPLQEGRQSGILTPRFSVNDVVRTSSGFNRRVSNVGFYWAMSDYSDATVAMDWWSNNYTAMTGSLRYRWARRFLGGDVAARRFWRDDGRQDFAVSTRNNWELTERSRLNVSGNYVTSTGLVRRSSMESRELTSSIDSNAGLQQRFDWGALSVSARRQQFLSDDRVEMMLPNASLTISTFTLFPEAPAQARWFNNLSVSGGGNFQRDTREFPFQADTIFRFSRADRARTQASGRASATLGNLSLSGQARYEDLVFSSIPRELAGPGGPLQQPEDGLPPFSGERVSINQGRIDWSSSLSYQQRLIGTTTITPSVSVSGQLLRMDTIPQAVSFVEGPTRLSVGLAAQTEVFGFYPGFGPFEALRHKITPGISYQYAPEITPTELQRRVFGARDLRVQNQFTLSFNQTWEARLREPEEARDDEDVEAAERMIEEEEELEMDEDRLPLSGDEIQEEIEGLPERPRGGLDPNEPRRLPESRVVTVLGLSTSALTYDLVELDETGRFLDGFRETQLRNTVRSDFLRGLDLSFTHDLFEDTPLDDGDRERRFRPHLSQLALGFSVDHRSGIVRFLGRLFGEEEPEEREPEAREREREREEEEDPFGLEMQDRRDVMDGFDESRVLPGSPRDPSLALRPRRDGWDARISYSLRRPRDTAFQQVGFGPQVAQMISGTLSFQPTAQWDATWQTSFDIEEGRFNDHMLRLRRDLHEWEATFGFRQAANGNWSFQFEVSLKANRDLRFDYEQRNLEGDALGTPGPIGPF